MDTVSKYEKNRHIFLRDIIFFRVILKSMSFLHLDFIKNTSHMVSLDPLLQLFGDPTLTIISKFKYTNRRYQNSFLPL